MSRRRRSPYRGADHRTRAAKAAGYPARSVFKLSEIDRRSGLLAPGQRVLDLGAAPGSWSAYAAKQIGPAGRLVAVDRQPITAKLGPTCTLVTADVLELDLGLLQKDGPFDVVLSDMAPNTSGDKNVDQWRSFHLFTAALDIALATLRPGGSFVGKLFMGASFEEARDRVRARFDEVRVIRPEGTRKGSYEVFLVGLGSRVEGPGTD